MASIENPILPGFNPDPSIVRVDDNFYIATSTFEWFPGVQIHHSKDLVNWRLLGHALTRKSQLDLTGVSASCGVWAPCLSHDGSLFHLIFTNVHSHHGDTYKDTPNFLVTAPEITGPWSEPIYLNSSGFDPSMFHDDNGRKWLVNMVWDYRQKGVKKFAGIVLREYSPEQKRLVGPIRNIFKGSDLGVTEGPHLYKRNGWYYLLTAEGGTGCEHAVTIARSRDIDGPYEIDPENPILTSRDKPDVVLRKAGHGSIVDTPNGEWYLAHLCSRRVKGRSMLGRETAIQKCRWTDDGWFRLANGTATPDTEVSAPNLPLHPFEPLPVRDEFDRDTLDVNFSTLRLPTGPEWQSLTQRPGFLRLYGRESLVSRFDLHFVARRFQHFRFRAQTCLEYDPETWQQTAGLVCFYNNLNYYYLFVSCDDHGNRVLGLTFSDNGKTSYPLDNLTDISGWPRFHLRVNVTEREMRFSASPDEHSWKQIGDVHDSTKLSDDYTRGWGFTGAFVGVTAQDLRGTRKAADFGYFDYEPEG